MRILLFSNWLPPILSGSSFYTSSVAQSLAARGHDVAVVTLDWGPENAPPADLPFPVYRLPVWRLPRLSLFYNLRLMGAAFTPANRRRLLAIVKEHRAQVLHHVNHIFDSTFLSTGAARRAGIPVVGSITTPIQNQSRLKQRLMEMADRNTVGRFGVCRWDGIVSLDATVHDYVGQVYGPEAQKRSVIIPFGVRREAMSLYEDRSQARSARPQILFVGHIHPFRNPVQLVRAMPLVLKAVPQARLVLAGRTDLQEPVLAARELGLTEDQVSFLGETPHDRIVQLMKTSHCFANWVTGPYHSLGTAPMEAMLCETPVINDLPEDLFGAGKLKNGTNICLVDSNDPKSIAAAIIRLLQDDAYRQAVGAAGRRFVVETLSWDSIAEQLEALYERLTNGRAAVAEMSGMVPA